MWGAMRPAGPADGRAVPRASRAVGVLTVSVLVSGHERFAANQGLARIRPFRLGIDTARCMERVVGEQTERQTPLSAALRGTSKSPTACVSRMEIPHKGSEGMQMRTEARVAAARRPSPDRCAHCGAPLVERFSYLERRRVRMCLGNWRSSELGAVRLPCGAPDWGSRTN